MQSNICKYYFFFLHECMKANTSSHIPCPAAPSNNPPVRFSRYDFRPRFSCVQNQSARHLVILDKWCAGWSIAIIYVDSFHFLSVECILWVLLKFLETLFSVFPDFTTVISIGLTNCSHLDVFFSRIICEGGLCVAWHWGRLIFLADA